jgi:hypothetical protein
LPRISYNHKRDPIRKMLRAHELMRVMYAYSASVWEILLPDT